MRGQICIIYAIFRILSDSDETWRVLDGAEQHEDHFTVIRGPPDILRVGGSPPAHV